MKLRMIVALALLAGLAATAPAQGIKLAQRPMDPFGSPRPAQNAIGVPPRTSIYFELDLDKPQEGDKISTSTIAVTLQAVGREPRDIVAPGGQFARGFKGWIKPAGQNVAVYIEPGKTLDTLTTYTVKVTARSLQGAKMMQIPWIYLDRWSFRTGAQPRKQTVSYDLDLAAPPVHWQGLFFSGFCKVGFCDSALGLEPSYKMMARDREKFPRAWILHRDFWLTGMNHESSGWGMFFSNLPNIVRELETRHITAITTESQGYLLKVGDFEGHEQYGIPSGRPLSEDYKNGYEILIADGTSHARAKVLAVDDAARTVLVSRFEMPAAGFKVTSPSMEEELRKLLKDEYDLFDPSIIPDHSKLPGIFPKGGTYLRRFAPTGTARYYWGRLDQEWDIARKYKHRLMPNFTDAPGDLSVEGQNWCPPKDYAQLHETLRAITSHIIERYGAAACLEATWSIFNEPDLKPTFWHGTWEELYKFYDYSTDGILRAFEDHGLDSNKVFIGGLELGAIFTNLVGLDDFLRHCSPNDATSASLNAAFADARLDGKRSRRVEALCRAHEGRGTPCDFISIHAYNSSKVVAGKYKLAKEKALAIDPAYYDKLWICSHEATPDWMVKMDEAFNECYMGNGYFPGWCADVVWRQLTQAAQDPRYAMGNTLLTYWPWPAAYGFGNTCSATQAVRVDDNGDGKSDREPTLPMQIYNFLNMLGSLGENYWVLPERMVNGHTVAGFASRGAGGELRVLLYAHDPEDVQSRGDVEMEIKLSISGLKGPAAQVTQYRFDQNHHSYLKSAKKITSRFKPKKMFEGLVLTTDEFNKLDRKVALKGEKVGNIKNAKNGSVIVPARLTGNGATFIVIQ